MLIKKRQKLPEPTYLLTTARVAGGIAMFQLAGEADFLARNITDRINHGSLKNNALPDNGLIFGKFFSDSGDLLDEVVLGRLAADKLLLMCHGGILVCSAIENYLKSLGFIEKIKPVLLESIQAEEWFGQLQLACLTETQLALLYAGKQLLLDNWDRLFNDRLFRQNWREKAKKAENLLKIQHICLLGLPNAGKSSLLNCLLGHERAFVNSEAGATRDVVAELEEIAGYAVILQDLPGFQTKGGEIYQQVWHKAETALQQADIVLLALDISSAWQAENSELLQVLAEKTADLTKKLLVVLNKADLPAGSLIKDKPWREYLANAPEIAVSALQPEETAEALREALAPLLGGGWQGEALELPLPPEA